MTIKQSNINNETHLKEDCQVLLFRFKNEFGKEKSLVEPKGRRSYPEFCPKDFTPRCTHRSNSSLDLIIKYSPYFQTGFHPASARGHLVVPGFISSTPVNN